MAARFNLARSAILTIGVPCLASLLACGANDERILADFEAENLSDVRDSLINHFDISSASGLAMAENFELLLYGDVLFRFSVSPGDLLLFRFDRSQQRIRYAVQRGTRVHSFGDKRLKKSFEVVCSICRLESALVDDAIPLNELNYHAVFEHRFGFMGDSERKKITLCAPETDFGLNFAVCLNVMSK